MAKIKAFRGDTFRPPRLKIGSENFTESYLTGSAIKFQIRDLKGGLMIEALTEHITTSVVYEKPDPSLPYMWLLSISILIPYMLMEFSAGEYVFDTEVTYPNGIRKTYNQTSLTLKQDISHG